ncbi:TEK-like protein [Aphanizomenon flos-aquae NRERC-008]|uniref:TEK-like protein n=1 Tax=Aphanizomenon flos-aquae TaxID=1176 RepID=UPI00287F13F3|nr:TEK-like protein [Aphanizomenon flos-aquae]MDS9398659.1 TEK-like protein [Aphanizomenon flos-aquae NRERC-008]
MKTTSNKVLKAAAIASLLAGGAIAGSFISTESAQAQTTTVQAQDSQSRVSGAVTNTFSNGIANSFAAEILYPQNNYAPSGTVSMSISYGTAGGDASKVVITGATMSGPVTTYSASTVEAATARAIDGARTDSRFDDVNGIVKSWRDSNGLD